MVETGGREGLRLFPSPLKIKEARKWVGFASSAELSSASDWGWSHTTPLLFCLLFILLPFPECAQPSSVPITWLTCHISPLTSQGDDSVQGSTPWSTASQGQMQAAEAGRGWKHHLPFLAVARHWSSLMPSQFVGKNREQLTGDLIVLWDRTGGNICFPGTTHEAEGCKMNKEMVSLCERQRTVWSLAIHLFCFLWYWYLGKALRNNVLYLCDLPRKAGETRSNWSWKLQIT